MPMTTASPSWCRAATRPWWRFRPSVCAGCASTWSKRYVNCGRRSIWSTLLYRCGRSPLVSARVARTACSLCKGWCCRNGDDDAFLDDRTLARVRLAGPDTTEAAMLRRYLERVPPVVYRSFAHLSRQARLHVGPVDACRCLQQLLLRRPWRIYEGRKRANANKVFAGEGEKLRTSPVLMPQGRYHVGCDPPDHEGAWPSPELFAPGCLPRHAKR